MDALSRRQFSAQAVLALLSGVAVTITGCSSGGNGGGGGNPMQPNQPSNGDEVGTISGNHGHSAIIAAAQLSAGQGFTLSIAGSADHPHTVELTAGEVTQIAGGQRVSKNSSFDGGHTHLVTFN